MSESLHDPIAVRIRGDYNGRFPRQQSRADKAAQFIQKKCPIRIELHGVGVWPASLQRGIGATGTTAEFGRMAVLIYRASRIDLTIQESFGLKQSSNQLFLSARFSLVVQSLAANTGNPVLAAGSAAHCRTRRESAAVRGCAQSQQWLVS